MNFKVVCLMKKTFILLALSLIVAAFVSSCKVIDPCPAYGNGSISVEQADNSSL